MKKKTVLFASLGLVLILIFAQFAVAKAWTGDETLDDIYQQMHGLRQQEVERMVELGKLSPEEGASILERMGENYQNRKENGRAGGYFCHGEEGPGGFGMWGSGHMRGSGRMMQGSGPMGGFGYTQDSRGSVY